MLDTAGMGSIAGMLDTARMGSIERGALVRSREGGRRIGAETKLGLCAWGGREENHRGGGAVSTRPEFPIRGAGVWGWGRQGEENRRRWFQNQNWNWRLDPRGWGGSEFLLFLLLITTINHVKDLNLAYLSSALSSVILAVIIIIVFQWTPTLCFSQLHASESASTGSSSSSAQPNRKESALSISPAVQSPARKCSTITTSTLSSGLRRQRDIAKSARRVGFEVVKEKDLAEAPAKPWWSRLK